MNQVCFMCGATPDQMRMAPVLTSPMGGIFVPLCPECEDERATKHQQTQRTKDALEVVTGQKAASILNGKR